MSYNLPDKLISLILIFLLIFYLFDKIFDIEGAISIAKQGLNIDPNRADLHAVIAWSLIFWSNDLENKDEILFHLKKSIELIEEKISKNNKYKLLIFKAISR